MVGDSSGNGWVFPSRHLKLLMHGCCVFSLTCVCGGVGGGHYKPKHDKLLFLVTTHDYLRT